MKSLITFITLCIVSSASALEKVTTVDFVQIQNNNEAEAVFYYENNWKRYRISAQKKGFIESFMLLKTVPTETAPFEFMLITTYKNKEQFNKREENFQPLMTAGGELRLLNEKQPPEFRKTLFYVDGVSR